MNLPSIDTTGTLIGIIALVWLEVDKRRRTRQADERWQNGQNPVVKALDRLEATTVREHEATRTKIVEVFASSDKRQEEHETREERQWEAVARDLREHRP